MSSNEEYIGSPDNPKTTGVVSYITFIGWLIAYFGLYPQDKTSLSAFHLRQSLLLHILSLILNIIYSFVLQPSLVLIVIITLCGIGLFIIWLMGLISALNGVERPVPIVGQLAQNLFRKL